MSEPTPRDVMAGAIAGIVSWYMPDTTLHRLNGSYVVDISTLDAWLKDSAGWVSADEADALAHALHVAAELARNFIATEEASDE